MKMRKIFCLLIAGLFLFPLVVEARREPDHIGISKAQGNQVHTGTQIVRGDAKIWSVNLAATAEETSTGSWLTLYDEYEAPLDEENIIMEIEVASAGDSKIVVLRYPIDVSNGLYAIGENGTYIILYE